MKRTTLLTQVFIIIIFANLSAQPTNGLIARIPMNQIVEDVVGNHEITTYGIPFPALDRNGNSGCALNFSNAYSVIEDGIDFSLAQNRQRTLSLWFKRNVLETEWISYLFSKNYLNEEFGDFSVLFGNPNDLMINAGPLYFSYDENSGYIPDLEWHHLAIVIGTDLQFIYLDGNLLVVTEYTINGGPYEGQVLIGQTYDGCLDDIYFYDRALNSEEITQLYLSESDCSSIDTINNKRITGTLFNDLNSNNVKENNEPYLNNFDLFFSPTNTSVRTNVNGYFQIVLDKNQGYDLNLSLDSQAVWKFTTPQNQIDLTNFIPYVYELGNIAVHKRPKKEVLVSATLFSDENGNNIFDGNDTLLPDFALVLNPSDLILTSDAVGYFEHLLDSGDVQTLSIPVSQQLYWEFSSTPVPIDLINYTGSTYELGLVGIHPKPKVMVAEFVTSFPATIAHSRNGECRIVLNNEGNVIMNGTLKVSITGQQLFRKFAFPPNHTETLVNDSTVVFDYTVENLNPFDSIITGFTLFSQAPVNSKIHIDYVYTDISGYTIQGSYIITVIAPHDPNYIAVDHQEIFKQFINEQRQLSYTVHFQNLGNASAENVVIRQQLPNELKSDYIYVIGASSSVVLEKINSGNSTELVWHFNDVNLPSISDDTLASTGYISFSMFPETLEKDDSIILDADIYFDAQDAVHTNEAITTLICKGIVGQNMVDFIPFDALCFGEATGGVLMQANIDTTELSIVLNNGNIIHFNTDSLLLAAGNYVVKTTDELGCSQSQNFSVKQPSILNSSIIDINETQKELLIGGGTPPYSILWSNGYTGYEFDKLPFGINTYIITDANGCMIDGMFEQSTLGNDKSTFSNIRIYPNPTNSLLNIECPKNGYCITILDLQGRKLRVFNDLKDKAALDISDLTPQVYVLKLTSNDGETRLYRIIKQ